MKKHDIELHAISAVTQLGVKELVQKASVLINTYETVTVEDEEEEIVYSTIVDPSVFEIVREIDGSFRILGNEIERLAQATYWEYDDAVLRFQNIIEKLGVRSALEDHGIRPGDKVFIGVCELEWVE